LPQRAKLAIEGSSAASAERISAAQYTTAQGGGGKIRLPQRAKLASEGSSAASAEQISAALYMAAQGRGGKIRLPQRAKLAIEGSFAASAEWISAALYMAAQNTSAHANPNVTAVKTQDYSSYLSNPPGVLPIQPPQDSSVCNSQHYGNIVHF